MFLKVVLHIITDVAGHHVYTVSILYMSLFKLSRRLHGFVFLSHGLRGGCDQVSEQNHRSRFIHELFKRNETLVSWMEFSLGCSTLQRMTHKKQGNERKGRGKHQDVT